MFLGILGGTPQHWAQYGRAYRQAWTEAGHPAEAARIAVAVHGFVADNDRQAKANFLSTYLKSIELLGTKVLPQIRKKLQPPAPGPALGGATTATPA
jgi:alkanesulfonate monooxygenase SsuD/methylene tetrahydromethanopterin reductase-like flavin-dependent oxidoreductase (luciferase family)